MCGTWERRFSVGDPWNRKRPKAQETGASSTTRCTLVQLAWRRGERSDGTARAARGTSKRGPSHVGRTNAKARAFERGTGHGLIARPSLSGSQRSPQRQAVRHARPSSTSNFSREKFQTPSPTAWDWGSARVPRQSRAPCNPQGRGTFRGKSWTGYKCGKVPVGRAACVGRRRRRLVGRVG